jgi:hypothetical protein
MANWFDTAMAAIMGSKNPEAFATYAAQNGVAPPTGAGAAPPATGASLGSLLNPSAEPQSAFAGISPPAAPEAQLPSAPSTPGQLQNIVPQTELIKLLFGGLQKPPAGGLSGLLKGQ